MRSRTEVRLLPMAFVQYQPPDAWHGEVGEWHRELGRDELAWWDDKILEVEHGTASSDPK